MTISIARKTLDDIHAHAEATYPEECCGLLIADGNKRVFDSIKMKNAYVGPKHDRYNIDPLELFKADRTISQKGLEIVGIYHSHPDYPAKLSQFDLEHSFSWYSYVIVSVPKGRADDTRSWIPTEDHKFAVEERIEIVE